MADKRTIKFEIGVDADTKGVERFGRVLNDLQKAAPIADSELRKVRQAVLEFSQQSGTSANSLKALESALTKLQSEAAAGGNTWKLLGKDIAGVRQQLGELTGTIRSAEQAQKDLNRALAAPIGNTFGKIANQTADLKRELRDLNFRSAEYLQTLTRIREVETVGSFNQGRLNTIAANQAFMGATLSRGYGASERLPGLPDTIAGDSQRVSELTERIRNLDRGSELYLQTVKELATAQAQAAASQAQLNRAVDGGAASYERLNATQSRRDAKLGAIGQYYASGDIATRRNDGFGDRPQAQRTASGTFIAPPYRSGNFIGIGDAGLGQFGPETPQDYQRRVEPLIASYEAAQERLTQAKRDANARSIQQEINEQRLREDAIEQLSRQSLKTEDERFKREIADFDRKLEARTRQREQRRRRLREAGETATAVGVAGYFGGPEAVAGAAAGAIFGPGGAQIGTTVGLGAGALRQQVARFSDQSAQLNKLQLSLRSIAGSESEYTRAMNAITRANREFNIPLLEGTRAMTQLTAAVRGAGGTVADAELAYRGITAAIKATGGSSADADGAIRALVQTFSKGKVSAEEIRQQLAERLPGAVTLFAQATGRTGAELDKAFEKGQVGLNDLMKFLATLNTRYSETARRIAASNDEAGLRLQLRWEQTTLAIGKAFQPLGAEIQNNLVEILKAYEAPALDTIRALTTSVKTLAGAFELIANNKDAALTIAGFVVQVGIARVGIIGLTAAMTAASGASLTLTGRLVALRAAVIGLTRAWVPALVLTVSVRGAKEAIDAISRARRAAGFTEQGFISDIGGNALALDDLRKRRKAENDRLFAMTQQAKLVRLRPQEVDPGAPGVSAFTGSANRAVTEAELSVARRRLAAIDAEIARRQKQSSGPQSKLTNFGSPAADAASKDEADKQRGIAEQLAAEQQRLRETAAQQEIRLTDEVYRHQIELDDQRYERRRRRLEDQARAEIALLSPNRRDIASLAFAIQQGSSEDAAQRRQLEQAVQQAQRQVANAQRMAAVTAVGGATGGVIARTGSTGVSTGAHLDARWADGRPISAADVDRYLRVNGRAPSSFGVTSGYGPRRAPAPGASSFHRGVDFATPAGSGISVANGAKLLRDLGFTGAGGYAVEIDTPQGRMRLLHLQGGSATRTPTGVAAQQRRNVVDNADVLSANQGLASAQANLAAFDADQTGGAQARTNRLIAEYTQQTRDSTQALLENNQQLRDRTRYTLEGYRPEDIEFLVQKNAAERKYNDTISQARAELDAQRWSVDAYNKLIAEQTDAHLRNVDALRQQADAQREARLAAESGFDIRAGARQYVESIGTMREASATLTQTGIKGIEEALLSLATTGSANFQAFAVSILQDTTRMIIQQLVLKTIMQAIGFLNPAAAAGGGGFSFGGSGGGFLGGFSMPSYMQTGNAFGFAKGDAFTEQGIQLFAQGGIVDKPTLFKFANGGAGSLGLMGEAGPEAIMPLKRGADGKLGVAGGGGVHVGAINISVENTGKQLDPAAQKQIANQVQGIVLATLVNQKRAGGIL